MADAEMPSRQRRLRADRSRPGRRSIRTGVLLAALAVLPLVGAGWFGAGELRTASTVSRQVAGIDPLTDDLVLLTDLRTRLLDEYNWSTVVVGMVAVGFPPELAGELTGVDLLGERAAAIDDVDRLLVALGITDLAADLDELRDLGEGRTPAFYRETDVVAIYAERYEVLERTIVNRSGEVLDRLLTIAGRVEDGDRLVRSLRVLEAAAEARRALASQLIGYFTAQFSSATVDDLIVQSAVFRRSTDEVRRLAPPGSRVAGDLAVIDATGDTAAFTDAVDALAATRLQEPADAAAASAAAVLGQLDVIIERYGIGSRAAEAHLELVGSAGADVASSGVAIRDAADADRDRAQVIIVLLVLASVLLSVLSTRTIVGPLRQLATSARQLRDGELHVGSPSHGPVEVREAAAAIDEAAAHLRLAERQATALADGDLDHPSLAQEAPGSLGRSLQSAVRTLTASLNESEGFRRKLAHEATHDALTQLPNRRASLAALEEALARSKRAGSDIAVLFIDLDGFKEVNDLNGHQAGDAVLHAAAARLTATARAGEHVGRLGGDEFLVVAEPIGGVDDAVTLGNRLLAALSAPIDVGATTVSIGASIGIAVPDPDDLTPDEILRDADLALYRAKNAGRGQIAVADDDLSTRAGPTPATDG